MSPRSQATLRRRFADIENAEFSGLKWGAYHEIADYFSKELLIDVIVKDASKYLKEREFDVSMQPC